ncbi:MAG: hypothetical protein M3290_11195, partial [Actinomycetota bacterium]|nr:hypothetical protein [Actinomycetota bacterium]
MEELREPGLLFVFAAKGPYKSHRWNQGMNPTGNQASQVHQRPRGGQRVAILALLIAEIGLVLYLVFLRHLPELE